MDTLAAEAAAGAFVASAPPCPIGCVGPFSMSNKHTRWSSPPDTSFPFSKGDQEMA